MSKYSRVCKSCASVYPSLCMCGHVYACVLAYVHSCLSMCSNVRVWMPEGARACAYANEHVHICTCVHVITCFVNYILLAVKNLLKLPDVLRLGPAL